MLERWVAGIECIMLSVFIFDPVSDRETKDSHGGSGGGGGGTSESWTVLLVSARRHI